MSDTKAKTVPTPRMATKGNKKDAAPAEPVVPAAPQNGSSRFSFADGSSYEGDWRITDNNGKKLRHGKGEYVDVDGTRYTGQWSDDTLEQGRIEWPTCSYEGAFNKAGEYHGRGAYQWEDKSRYEGEFVNGLMQGEGALTLSNGHNFRGSFYADQFLSNGHWRAPHVPLHYQ